MKARFNPFLSSLIILAIWPVWGLKAAYSQPITPAVDTRTNISSPASNPSQFDISGGSRAGANLFHSFQQFGLSQGQTANFLSDPSLQNILGRVIGGQASTINGLLQVTGGNSNLFLMNPAGLIFGPHARLNVPASFMATTADGIRLGNGWFNAIGPNDYSSLMGTPNGVAFLGTQPGAILNAGILQAGQGQSLTLLGGTVINTGTIEAPGGTITIAAVPGKNVVHISQEGSLLSLEVPTQNGRGLNPPDITPLSLPALLTGGGVPEATGLTVENGFVKLTGSGTSVPTAVGTATVSGSLSVSAATPQNSAKIQVLGDRVALLNAHLNTSGPNGGGTVLVGGNEQGQGPLPQAQSTSVDATTRIQANALTQGNGGQVVVWANEKTQVQGQITATGGAQGGNGGLVETSGRQQLAVTGARVDASAARGLPGTWVIDPSDITIATTGGTVTPTQIATSLDSGTNVSLTTASGNGGNGDITLADSVNQTGGGTAALTLTGRRFANPGNTTISMTSTGGLTVNLNQVNPEANAPTSSIQSAINAIGAVGGSRVINLGSGMYTGDTIPLDRSLNLNGAGASNTTVSGNNAYRVFNIAAGSTVSLDGLTIANGSSGYGDGGGGGIYNAGALTLNNSSLSGNLAIIGGGISNDGIVTLNNSTLSGNSANIGGGIYNGGVLTLNHSTLTANSATSGYFSGGGSIYNSGVLTLNHSTLTANSATSGYFGGGGGIYNSGVLTLNHSTLTGNLASGFLRSIGVGGGIYNSYEGTLTLNNSTLSGNSATIGGGIYNSGVLTLNHSTLTANSATGRVFGYGGGIYNGYMGTLTLNQSTLSSNSASIGGGIYNDGTLTLNHSDLTDNSASGNFFGGGGGIYNSYEGTLTLNHSTLRANSASSGGGIDNKGVATINHSTLTGNSANGGFFGDGGGIYNGYNGTLTLNHSTLRANSASGNGGGIYNSGGYAYSDAFYGGSGYGFTVHGGKVVVSNSILSGNAAFIGGGIYNAESRAPYPYPGYESRADLAGNLTVRKSIVAGNRSSFGSEIANFGTFEFQGISELTNALYDRPDIPLTMSTQPGPTEPLLCLVRSPGGEGQSIDNNSGVPDCPAK
jgi:filamentous hemagglutinin family protein